MDFWTDHRLLVTGGAGFLGTFVVEVLGSEGPRTAMFLAVRSMICGNTKPCWRFLRHPSLQ